MKWLLIVWIVYGEDMVRHTYRLKSEDECMRSAASFVSGAASKSSAICVPDESTAKYQLRELAGQNK